MSRVCNEDDSLVQSSKLNAKRTLALSAHVPSKVIASRSAPAMTSWRPRGSEIGSSNGCFQPVGVLREAMRALLRNVRNVDQVFLEAVTVEDVAARAFQNRCCTACPVHNSAAQGACQHPTARIFARSNLSDRATPENRIVSQFEVTQYDTIGYRSA